MITTRVDTPVYPNSHLELNYESYSTKNTVIEVSAKRERDREAITSDLELRDLFPKQVHHSKYKMFIRRLE